MAHSHFDQFLREATYSDPDSDSILDGDSLYGWCCLSGKTPRAERSFWAAMNERVLTGQRLKMKGPAAADYILSSYQAVV